jgi:hypothetical protein
MKVPSSYVVYSKLNPNLPASYPLEADTIPAINISMFLGQRWYNLLKGDVRSVVDIFD